MTLTFSDWGRGSESALFIHGFTGNRDSFNHLEPLVGDELNARSIDVPGHNGTPVVAGDARTAFRATLAAIASTMRGPSAVIGYSQGARLALGLAVEYPELVSRLVLESGSPGIRQRHHRTVRRLADESLARELELGGVEMFEAHWSALPLFAGLRRLPSSMQQELRARRLAHTEAGLAWALRFLGQGVQPDYWSALPRVRVPTLLVTGKQDAKYTRLAKRMASELPLSWTVSLPGVGHSPHLETPERYASEVTAFLRARWTHEPEPGALAL